MSIIRKLQIMAAKAAKPKPKFKISELQAALETLGLVHRTRPRQLPDGTEYLFALRNKAAVPPNKGKVFGLLKTKGYAEKGIPREVKYAGVALTMQDFAKPKQRVHVYIHGELAMMLRQEVFDKE